MEITEDYFMSQNDEFIEEIHRANPIENIMSSYIQLKKHGKTYLC